jgi:muconate cycloisomerase
MRIAQIEVILASLPLKHPMQHAADSYRETANLFVCCRLADGTEGWGEGIPRRRLTGQAPLEAWEYLVSLPLRPQLSPECQSWADVVRLCWNLRTDCLARPLRKGFDHPLRCALELAVLDAFGRYFGQPIREAARFLPGEIGPLGEKSAVQYSATIMGASPATEAVRALFVRWYGFRHCKIKVGLQTDLRREIKRIRRLRRLLGREMDIRLDANGAWSTADLHRLVPALTSCRISALEDPVSAEELPALAAARKRIPVAIILDEPVITEADVTEAAASGACDIVNIRLSKCGGFLRSVSLAARLRAAGIGVQLGCHPGESGLLSAAGRHFATIVPELRYVEGSYDRFIFRKLVTKEDLTFGRGGWAPTLSTPGVGASIDRRRLAPFILREQTVAIM